jgi:uncharacterized protein YggU (UPF0235/DUF167 family)
MQTVSVIAHPRSKKSRIEKDEDGVLHVYVHAQSKDGKANAQIITALALHFAVAKSLVVLKRGVASKIKTFVIG